MSDVKRDTYTGEWRQQNNRELHTLYPSPDVVRIMKFQRLRWASHVPRMGESVADLNVIAETSREKIPQSRPRQRWKDNIKTHLTELRCSICG